MPKQPLYPHIPRSQKPQRGIYCYIPTKTSTVGIMCFYTDSREQADEKAAAVDFYELEFAGTWDDIGERIKRTGEQNWLGEVGY